MNKKTQEIIKQIINKANFEVKKCNSTYEILSGIAKSWEDLSNDKRENLIKILTK